MGGTLSVPLVSGVLSGCNGHDDSFMPQTLSPEQNDLVTAVVDRIIPATDTPGAADVGVNQFIDHMLTDWYPVVERDAILRGFGQIDERAQETHGTPFLDLTEVQQVDLLEALDAEMIEHRQAGDDVPPHFFFRIKELTLAGYYTSEAGMTDELQYDFLPGRFDACLPVEEVPPHHPPA